jgi:hypothetical protein
MKISSIIVSVVTGVLLLSGCSGSSSSGATTSYAGQYDGTVVLRLSGLGETVNQTLPMRVIVGVDGRVTAANPNASAGGQCSFNTKPVFLTGNSVTASGTISCSVEGLGTCAFTGTESISFSNNAASMTGNYTIDCPQGRVNGDMSGYLKKTV